MEVNEEVINVAKHLSLMKLTDKGREHFTESADFFEKSMEAVDSVGGKVVCTYALDGQYDFLSVIEYPTPEAAFEARVKVVELGVLTIETCEAFDIDFFLTKV